MSEIVLPSNCSVYALRASNDADHKELVHEDLRRGVARFGFSYVPTADLHALNARIDRDGWESLTVDERDCYAPFLLEVRPGDYLVYVNLPLWGRCTVARVANVEPDDVYSFEWDPNVEDFAHHLRVDAASIREFDRNAVFVHPALSARLKLQPRWWRIKKLREFEALLRSLDNAAPEVKADVTSRLQLLASELREPMATITRMIHDTHPNYDLEKLVERVLNGSLGVVDVERRGGAGDRGADLLVTTEQMHPLTGALCQVVSVIQVKSFEGEHADPQAINDIRRAFHAYPHATEGLIVSTAAKPSPEFLLELDRARETEGKDIHLLIGTDVAAFFLRHGWDALGNDGVCLR